MAVVYILSHTDVENAQTWGSVSSGELENLPAMLPFRCDVERGVVASGRLNGFYPGVRPQTHRVSLATFPDVSMMETLLHRFTVVTKSPPPFFLRL